MTHGNSFSGTESYSTFIRISLHSSLKSNITKNGHQLEDLLILCIEICLTLLLLHNEMLPTDKYLDDVIDTQPIFKISSSNTNFGRNLKGIITSQVIFADILLHPVTPNQYLFPPEN